MISFKAFRSAVCAALCFAGIGAAHADLFDRGGGLIYDSVLNVTWLQDANYAFTSGYSTANGGQMTWNDASSWAANLSYGGYTDWRLPTTAPVNGIGFDSTHSDNGSTDFAYNISAPGSAYPGSTASELAYMFFVNLGNKAGVDPAGNPQSGYGMLNTGPFSNAQNTFYWDGLEYVGSVYAPGYAAWMFQTAFGGQGAASKSDNYFAWAVRDGDVAVTAIPEPETYAMLLAGLGLLGWHARRRKRKLAA